MVSRCVILFDFSGYHRLIVQSDVLPQCNLKLFQEYYFSFVTLNMLITLGKYINECVIVQKKKPNSNSRQILRTSIFEIFTHLWFSGIFFSLNTIHTKLLK